MPCGTVIMQQCFRCPYCYTVCVWEVCITGYIHERTHKASVLENTQTTHTQTNIARIYTVYTGWEVPMDTESQSQSGCRRIGTFLHIRVNNPQGLKVITCIWSRWRPTWCHNQGWMEHGSESPRWERETEREGQEETRMTFFKIREMENSECVCVCVRTSNQLIACCWQCAHGRAIWDLLWHFQLDSLIYCWCWGWRAQKRILTRRSLMIEKWNMHSLIKAGFTEKKRITGHKSRRQSEIYLIRW